MTTSLFTIVAFRTGIAHYESRLALILNTILYLFFYVNPVFLEFQS